MLRIAHYNILNGGENRLNHITRVIKSINPDICGIIEAVGWNENSKKSLNLSKKIGFDYFTIAKANSKYNIGIYSKIPLEIKIIKNYIRHVVLKATILSGEFMDTEIFFIHLSPISETQRLTELNEIKKHIQKDSHVVIMGDFNSLSHKDKYNKKELLFLFKTQKIKKFGVQKLNFKVIKKVEKSGFIDTMNYSKLPFSHTVPTLSNQDPHHATKLRLDYAFVTKNLIKFLKKFEIVKNKYTEKASDHYPIYIELKK